MRLGAIFPQTEIGSDPVAVRDFAQAAEGLGYEHLLVFDHVLGADTSVRQGWDRPYSSADMFHEPFVLFGYLAGLTETIEMVTGVLILGQRQTSLVAKQAAEVDVLTGGRLRLGIGVGWNAVEYEGLSESFTNRGRRSEEQIELMRQLWTNEVVDFHGRYHNVTHAGINPLPVQQPIPVWFGGGAPQVVKRIGRMGDGWFPQFEPNSEGAERIAEMRGYATDAGRDSFSHRDRGPHRHRDRRPSQLAETGGVMGRGRGDSPFSEHHAGRSAGARPAHRRHPAFQGDCFLSGFFNAEGAKFDAQRAQILFPLRSLRVLRVLRV